MRGKEKARQEKKQEWTTNEKKEGNQSLSRMPLENSLQDRHSRGPRAQLHVPGESPVTCFSYASSCFESWWVARHISFCRERRKAGKMCPIHTEAPEKRHLRESPKKMYVCVCEITVCSEIIWKTRAKQIKRVKAPPRRQFTNYCSFWSVSTKKM